MSADPARWRQSTACRGGGCLELLFPPVLGSGSSCFALTGGSSKREVERVAEA